MKNCTFYNFRQTDSQNTSLCDFKKNPGTLKNTHFFHFGPGLFLALTLEDFSRFRIPRSSVKLHFKIGRWPPQNFFCFISNLFFVSNHDSIPYIKRTHTFFKVIHIFQLLCSGGVNFLSESGFLCVVRFRILRIGRAIPSCADFKFLAYDKPGNIACSCKINIPWRKSFFSVWHISRSHSSTG